MPPSALTPGEQGLIHDRQQKMLDEQRQRQEEIQQLPVLPDASELKKAPDDRPCFTIHRIRIQGADHMTETEQKETIRYFENQCLDSARINELLGAITNFYLKRGNITSRAYLPEQDISNSELEILVVEGKLEEIDNEHPNLTETEISRAFPGKTGELLNLRELEQMTDQLDRLLSRHIEIDIFPGKNHGESRIRIKKRDSPTREKSWHMNIMRGNYGEKTTGEQQANVRLSLDSPLGLADRIIINGGQDTGGRKGKHAKNQSLFYDIPIGWWTLSYNYSHSEYRARNKAAGLVFETSGKNQVHEFRADRVFHRDGASKTGVIAGLSHLRTRNYFEEAPLKISSHRLTEFQLAFYHGQRIGSAYVNADVGWQRGIRALDAQSGKHSRADAPEARYNKYTLTASYLHPFLLGGQQLSAESFLHIQRSEDALFSPQRVSLGGLYSVRGFKEWSLAGNSGGYWRNQLHWRRAVRDERWRTLFDEASARLFYDFGEIAHDGRRGDAGGRLSGQGIELAARGRYVSASLTFARSLATKGLPAGRRERPIYFSAQFAY
ncbi:MAG: ShlB/FhaC/HecB family hemolysin secretion/activation protein [Zoogloeaceae bacterium]|nr:ShlB/FhaC/HecB family hemolysin secretion/activation protein [Zoogloeaceae bacterium]